MPLTHISLRKGKPAAYRRAIAESVYEAMRATFAVPENDLFAIVNELEADNFIFDPTHPNVVRSDDLVIVQMTVSDTRNLDQKRALFREIVERLAKSPGLRPDDVFLSLIETRRENWSFGHGVAYYV